MSSKTKRKLTDVLSQNRKLKEERQRLVRALSAIVRKLGAVKITYKEACAVEEDDQIEVDFDKKSGVYTISLVGQSDEKRLGSESNRVGLSIRRVDVEDALPSQLDQTTQPEVREGDQHDSISVDVLQNRNEEQGRSEQSESSLHSGDNRDDSERGGL